jgi:DNA-binding transcriptional regulator YhcF (GntR family)
LGNSSKKNRLVDLFPQTENDYLILDITSEMPIYQQIHDQVVLAIAEGRLAEGAPLPTTRQLALDFKINFHTVNKAYDLLRREGFVSLTRKQGTFIRHTQTEDPSWRQDWQNRLRILMAEAVAKGQPSPDILETCSTILDSFPSAPQRKQNTIQARIKND